MTGPLDGLRIIEFAGLGPTPFGAMMLADHGAEVIRIERIGAKGLIADSNSAFLNRSRKNIGIDLKTAAGIGLARRLCARADGIVEGFRPGVMERLGLGPEVLIGDNPKLVYGRMTGWGQTGPYASMAGHDINYIALTGALHAIGRKGERPTPPLNLIGDFGGGGMMLAFGMAAALLSAQRTGKGQIVDCAMTEGSAVLMTMIYSMRRHGIWRDERGANYFDSGAHFYDTYETADGKFIAVGAIEPQFYKQFLELLGLKDDPDCSSQAPGDWARLKAMIAARIKTRTRAQWSDVFDGSDACVAPVMSIDEAPDHPHNRARGVFVDVGDSRQPAPAPRYSETRTVTPRPLDTGPDTAISILESAGLTAAEIKELREAHIIAA